MANFILVDPMGLVSKIIHQRLWNIRHDKKGHGLNINKTRTPGSRLYYEDPGRQTDSAETIDQERKQAKSAVRIYNVEFSPRKSSVKTSLSDLIIKTHADPRKHSRLENCDSKQSDNNQYVTRQSDNNQYVTRQSDNNQYVTRQSRSFKHTHIPTEARSKRQIVCGISASGLRQSDPAQLDTYTHTPTGVPGRRQIICGVAALQRNERQNRSLLGYSRVPSSPSSSKKLHIYSLKNPHTGLKANKVPVSDFETSTLPSFSSALSEPVSRRDLDSSKPTCEETSSESQVNEATRRSPCEGYVSNVRRAIENMTLKWYSLESPEAGIRKGQIFELCNGDDDDDDDNDDEIGVNSDASSSSDSKPMYYFEYNVNQKDSSLSLSDSGKIFNVISDPSHHFTFSAETASQAGLLSSTSQIQEKSLSDFDMTNTDTSIAKLDMSADTTIYMFDVLNVDTVCDSTSSSEGSYLASNDYSSYALDHSKTIAHVNIKVSSREYQSCDRNESVKKNEETDETAGKKARFPGLKKFFFSRQKHKKKESRFKSSVREPTPRRPKSSKEKDRKKTQEDGGSNVMSDKNMTKTEMLHARRRQQDPDLVCEIWGVGKIDSPREIKTISISHDSTCGDDP